MFRKFCISSILWFFVLTLQGQDIDSFNQKRLDINQKGMIVLGSWALLNIASAPVMASRSEGSQKYFYQMNGYWNIVNLAIAGFGFYSSLNGATDIDLAQSIAEQNKMEKILLFNAGLDVAYMLGGLYLTERSKNATKNPERLKGFGRSIMLQGAFLFTFDLILYGIHSRHGQSLLPVIEGLSFHPSLNGVGVSFSF